MTQKSTKKVIYLCVLQDFKQMVINMHKKAIEAGAAAIICEKEIQSDNKDVTIIQTKIPAILWQCFLQIIINTLVIV